VNPDEQERLVLQVADGVELISIPLLLARGMADCCMQTARAHLLVIPSAPVRALSGVLYDTERLDLAGTARPTTSSTTPNGDPAL
jgi:hypothetical protein